MLVPFIFSERTSCHEGTGLQAAPGARIETPRSPPGVGPRLLKPKSRSPGEGPSCAYAARMVSGET